MLRSFPLRVGSVGWFALITSGHPDLLSGLKKKKIKVHEMTRAVGASPFPANPGIWEKIGHVPFIPCHVVDLAGPMRLGALLR